MRRERATPRELSRRRRLSCLTPGPPETPPITAADLKLALADMEQFYDVAPTELEQLIHAAEPTRGAAASVKYWQPA